MRKRSFNVGIGTIIEMITCKVYASLCQDLLKRKDEITFIRCRNSHNNWYIIMYMLLLDY